MFRLISWETLGFSAWVKRLTVDKRDRSNERRREKNAMAVTDLENVDADSQTDRAFTINIPFFII